MAELGSYYITIMPSMKGFTSEVKSQLGDLGTESADKFSGGFIATLKGSAIGTTLGNLASRAGESIMDGLSVGINRLDTIQNFPRVMESLGYSTDEADKSIRNIMTHLDGLPTSTQDMVTLTQAISDSTGDLDLATRAALGFNDMMLANGASTAEMTNAQGVLNRVLGKGSATAAQWQSLCSVMPAQLGIVAKSMLGAGSSTEDLHAALEDGTVSWNDFLRAIADLDKSGYIDEAGNQIASFEEQARANSHGIGTAIDNVRNRIGAGWAEILDVIGREDIAGTIDKVSYGIRSAMVGVADAIGWLKEKIADTSIGESIARIFQGVSDFVGRVGTGAGPIIADLAERLIHFVDGALKWVADHGDTVVKILGAMAVALAFKEAVGAVKFLGDLGKNIRLVGEALELADGIKDLPNVFKLLSEAGGPLKGVFSNLTGGIKGAEGVAKTLTGSLANMEGGFGSIGTIGTALKGMLPELGGALSGVGSKILAVATGPVGIAVAAIVGLVAVFKTLWDTNEGFRNAITGIWEGLQEKFAAAGERIGKSLEAIRPVAEAVFGFLSKVGGDLLEVLGKVWDFVCVYLSPVIVAVFDMAANLIGGVVDIISGVIEAVAGIINGFLTGDMTLFSEGMQTIWNGVWSVLTAPVQAVFDAMGYILEQFGSSWDSVIGGVKSAWDGFCSNLSSLWDGLQRDWTNFTKTVDREAQSFQKFVGDIWNKMDSEANKAWSALSNGIKSNMDAANQAGSHAASALQAALSGDWQRAVDETYSAYQSIAQRIGESIGWARDTVRDVGNEIGNVLGFPGLGDRVSGVFDRIRDFIEHPIERAREFIEGAINDIENAFSGMSINIPDFELPHVDWHWEDLGGMLTIPVFDGISWYAKGGVFDAATLIGIGEAGKEAALPLNRKTYGEIARGIVGEMDGTVGSGVTITGNTFVVREEADIDRIADALNRKWRRERMGAV